MANGTGQSTAGQVQGALAAMKIALNTENATLRSMLNETEKITRQTVNAEVESKNNRFAQENLQDEIRSLTKQIRDSQKTKESRTLERDMAKKNSQKLDTENAGLKKDVADLEKVTAKLKSDNASLKKELAKQETKRDKLQADVNRLKELRAKYLAEIAEFKTK
jgi:chromosome segregation ATPase